MDNYTKYINNPKNGLVQEKTINGIKYYIKYRPAELLVLQHIKANDKLSKEEVGKLREHYNLQHHFMLSISQGKHEALKGATNFEQFSNLMQTMGFEMGNYIVLVTNERDTLHLIDSHFARTFGMGKSNDILLIFQKEEHPADEFIFQINEFGLKTGDTRFSFSVADLKKIEKKKIKESHTLSFPR